MLTSTVQEMSFRPRAVVARHGQLLVLDLLYVAVALRRADATDEAIRRTMRAIEPHRDATTSRGDRRRPRWPRVEEPLARAFARRAEERARNLDRMLEERQRREAAAAREVLEELARGITGALDEPAAVQLELFTSDERRQLQRDIDGLRDRLAAIPRDIEEAEDAVRHRYADPTPRHFPAAVTFYVPRRLAR